MTIKKSHRSGLKIFHLRHKGIQKLSSKFYEFRLAYKQASPRTDAPEYIRVNNFGERKTGWNTYNPVKVEVDVIGQIKRKIEKI